jgi:hypothetical protein
MAQPYNKLKVSNSISHVSVDDIKSAQQSDASLVKIGEQVKSEAILVNGSSSVKYYEKRGNFPICKQSWAHIPILISRTLRT